MATHSSILAQEIPWTEEPDGPQESIRSQSRTRLSTHTHTHIFSRGYVECMAHNMLCPLQRIISPGLLLNPCNSPVKEVVLVPIFERGN